MIPPALRPLDEHPELLARLAAFFQAGRGSAFLVGGYLRDSLLARPCDDVDLAVAGSAEHAGPALARHLSGVWVPIGSAHDTGRIVISDEARRQFHVDVTGFTHGIEQELQRRDFTMNALALPVSEWRAEHWAELVIDPTGGIADLARKQVRATGRRRFRR